MPKASVKIMRSYDYCHFEICLGTDEDISLIDVDKIRKDAQRLADKAVDQYKIAREECSRKISLRQERDLIINKVRAIKENFPESEWTEEQKALVKTLEDYEWQLSHDYDYEDNWPPERN